MDSDVVLRSFTEADRPEIIDLWHSCGLIVSWNDPDRDIDRKLSVDPDGLIVAVIAGRLVGSIMLGYGGHRGWVNYLAVAPERRRRGLGRHLMAHAERVLESRGCPKVNIQVRAANDDVIAFYEALGYRPETVVNLGKRLIAD